MTADTRSLTIDVDAAERLPSAAGCARMTLVFRWSGGRELVDLDRARSLTVGRGSASDLRIDDPSLSRLHARFVREGEELRVDDLDSRNGVTLEGKRVRGAALQSGDVLQLGHVAVSVHVFGGTQAPAVSAAPGESELNWAGARMQELRRTVEKIAPTPLPVLVLGETGCGKELIAHEIHRLSPRASGPLRVVNCAAIPATLIESTLFGHEKGAFTGADRLQLGVFEQALQGTIFLDEIGELSAAAQAALLRVLETGRFTRVGGSREIEANARVVAATHRDLHGMAQSGAFRLDLVHRLDAMSVSLPPLRERMDALEPLIAQFLERARQALGTRTKTFDAEAMAVLRAYRWPGNVRELRNVVERAVAISDSDRIGVIDLPERLRAPALQPTATGTSAPANASGPTLPPPALSEPGAVAAGMTRKELLAQQEQEALARALEECGGDQTAAAAKLGLSLRTLQRRVQQYGWSRSRR